MKNNHSNARTVLIIGAGAAGLMAGIRAAEKDPNRQVLIAERMERPGRKLLITGKGRCNVTNCCTIEEFMPNVLTNPRFLYSSLNALSPYEVMGFFEECGVPLKVERGERVFPVSTPPPALSTPGCRRPRTAAAGSIPIVASRSCCSSRPMTARQCAAR